MLMSVTPVRLSGAPGMGVMIVAAEAAVATNAERTAAPAKSDLMLIVIMVTPLRRLDPRNAVAPGRWRSCTIRAEMGQANSGGRRQEPRKGAIRAFPDQGNHIKTITWGQMGGA